MALDVTLDEPLEDAKPNSRARGRREPLELPPGLAELQQKLKLSDAEVEDLARINFRGSKAEGCGGVAISLGSSKDVRREKSATMSQGNRASRREKVYSDPDVISHIRPRVDVNTTLRTA